MYCADLHLCSSVLFHKGPGILLPQQVEPCPTPALQQADSLRLFDVPGDGSVLHQHLSSCTVHCLPTDLSCPMRKMSDEEHRRIHLSKHKKRNQNSRPTNQPNNNKKPERKETGKGKFGVGRISDVGDNPGEVWFYRNLSKRKLPKYKWQFLLCCSSPKERWTPNHRPP